MIEIKNVTKRQEHGLPPLLNNISFTGRNCKIYGLLGCAKSGKSTLLDIMAGVRYADEGTVLVNGYDITKQALKAKRQIGYMPECPPLFADMTPYEYLSFVAEVKGIKDELRQAQVTEALALAGLTAVQDRLSGQLSKTQQKKLALTQTLLGHTEVIILDEPTAGLPPRQANEIHALIKRLGQTKTVIVSGHILAEMSTLCDHILLLSEGRVIADGTPDALMSLRPSLEEFFEELTRAASKVPTVDFEDEENDSTAKKDETESTPEDIQAGATDEEVSLTTEDSFEDPDGKEDAPHDRSL